MAGGRHAGVGHGHAHAETVEAGEGLAHAGGEVAVLGVRGGFFERAEVVFAFVFFLFAAVAAVRTFGAIGAIVGTTMSVANC